MTVPPLRVIALGFIAALGCRAQDYPKAELFGGFSSVSLKPGPGLDRKSENGGAASFTSYQFFRRWGLSVEFGGDTRQQSYLFGGTFRGFRRGRIAATGRILTGVTRWNPDLPRVGGYRDQNAFTFGIGQSVDLRLSGGLSLRVQPDLRLIRFETASGSRQNSLALPISIGLVYKFGGR